MKTWVVKVGTSILRGNDNISTEEVIETLCKSFTKFLLEGNKLVLVTSGAVGLGCKKLNFKSRPNELSTLQAAAAVAASTCSIFGAFPRATLLSTWS